MNYGLPYQGSKNAIAEWVIGQLPEAETFVDLFCGGCAITHAAMLSGKYKKFIANDIIGANPQLFKECAEGRHTVAHHTEWISRASFFSRKASENWVNLCYSFGNGGENYSYAQEIEPWRRALHFARVLHNREPLAEFGINSDGSREDILAHAEEYKAKYITWYKTNVLQLSTSLEVEQERLAQAIEEESEKLRNYLIAARDAAGVTGAQVDRHLGTCGMSGHYFGKSQWAFPTREAYEKLQEIMPGLDQDFDNVRGLASLSADFAKMQKILNLENMEPERLPSLESLERIERLESLGKLGPLENLKTSGMDYQSVNIPAGAVVYCDIPYKDTDCAQYNGFDHERFYAWARNQKNIFISEYWMPDDFVELSAIRKLAMGFRAEAKEKLFTNEYTNKTRSFAGVDLEFRQYSIFDLLE